MSTATHRDPSGKFKGNVKGNSNGNNAGRFRANQPGTHTLAVRGRDSYPTPRIAVESLLNAEPDVLNTMARIWEPAAGDGNIVRVLRDNGIPVIASDIERYSFDLHFIGDFLQRERAPSDCQSSLQARCAIRRACPHACAGRISKLNGVRLDVLA
jgi:hypothetical protein